MSDGICGAISDVLTYIKDDERLTAGPYLCTLDAGHDGWHRDDALASKPEWRPASGERER